MSRRMLLVEDDLANRLTLSALFEEEGFRVEVASGCSEARVLIARTATLDVAVLDLRLGDGEGISLVPVLRACHPGVRIALWTGDPRPTAGVDLVLGKGAPFRELLASVSEVLCSAP